MPVYNYIGNPDLVGIYEESSENGKCPDHKYAMWEIYLGTNFYFFDHKS